MYPVWFLTRYTMGTDAYAISRSEDWSFRLASEFDTEEKAKDFVREQHRGCSEFIRRAHLLQGPDRDRYLEEFSFDPQYASIRSFFIGSKNDARHQIIQNLHVDGVRVIQQ